MNRRSPRARVAAGLLAMAVLLAAAPSAFAQPSPAKPHPLVVPFPAAPSPADTSLSVACPRRPVPRPRRRGR